MSFFNSRLFRFIIAIVAGMVVSIIYGWYLHPVQPQSTSLDNLRQDFKTDYVLMVAETYDLDNDITKAIASLENLGENEPIRYVQEAIISAQDLNYMQIDMQYLAQLAIDLQSKQAVPHGSEDD